MWILTVCIGILWGGMCEKVIQITYPTEQSCIFERNKLNKQISDGYATCVAKDK